MREPAAVADSVIKVAFGHFGAYDTRVTRLFIVRAIEVDAEALADAKRRSAAALASVASA